MSAYPPIATAERTSPEIRLVPFATFRAWGQTTSLFDHLISAGEQCGRKLDAECLGRLQVDDELELGR